MAALIVPIAACTEDDDNGSGTNGTVVSVVSMGNKGLKGVTVNATNGDGSISGITDDNGNVTLALDKSLSYQVEFTGLPKGYYADPSVSYTIKSNSTGYEKFYMPSKVIEGESVNPQYVYKTGDVMYDFSFMTTKGETVTLSEELGAKNKKAVLINFWGSGCGNCKDEFPAIEATYQMFQDKFTVMALDPAYCYQDTNAKIDRILSNWGLDLSFYYGLDATDLYKNMYAPAQNNGYALPESVIIDRYGVICEIIVGAETNAQKWQEAIAVYVSDNYVPEIKDGQTSDDVEHFVPDLPADFNAKMSDPADIDRAINNTGVDILFYADEGEYSWPWVLSKTGDSVVPLGSGHGRSYSMLYAELTINTNQALLVDYKVSSQEYYDQFAIIVDGNDLGRTTFSDSGNKDWQTALAYIPLTSGNHQILFVYSKGAQDKMYEDTVYLKNLRLVPADSANLPTNDISYYAARDFDQRNGTYKTYEEVYLDEKDGYYHIKGRENAGVDPYLFLDMTHMVPYTRSTSLYVQFISEKNTIFGGKNYYNELMTYAYVSGNSELEGMVPVTKELHDILIALCKHDSGEDVYADNPDMWLEFCVFYLHFGAGEAVGDPVKGLAYFSAYEAHLTDVYDEAKALEQIDTIYNAYEEMKKPDADTQALQALIDRTTEEYETTLATFNSVEFDTIIVPRGKVIKFTAPEDGVYHFYSVGREDYPDYICEAAIFGSDLKLHTSLAQPVAVHDSDTLLREGNNSQFHLYHYLKRGDYCYLNVMFYSTETLRTMHFAINKVADTEYKALKTVAAGYLTTSLESGSMGQLYRPLYTTVQLNTADNYYYDTKFNHRILVDFTGLTRYSESHSLANIIEAEEAGNPIKVAAVVDKVSTLIDVTFDFTDFNVKLGNETIVGRDYTQEMRDYLAQAKAVGTENPDYGLVEANKELRDILILFIAKYGELTVEEDWLLFCYFYEYFGANY